MSIKPKGNFYELLSEHFSAMSSTGMLFRANITGDEVYALYLQSFPAGTDPVFRDPSSTEHNCNNCKNFMRRYGNIVAVNVDGTLETIFHIEGAEHPYQGVADAVDMVIKGKPIASVFFESYVMLNEKLNYERCNKKQDVFRLGIAENRKQYTQEDAEKFGVVSAGEIRKFAHMYVDLPKAFVIMDGTSLESFVGSYREKHDLFKRAMEEIPADTLSLVEDLINQGSLLDGAAHLHVIKSALRFKAEYDSASTKETWLWKTSYGLDERTAKFKNSLIGVLCTELAQGEEINAACDSWNKRVDPVNYHKAKAPITKKQIEEAQKFVEENGYAESFERRLATIDDINVNEIKHIAVGNMAIPVVTVFDKVKPTAVSRHKRAQYDDVEEVAIDKFMSDILPKCASVDVLLLNRHEGNMVTLTTAKNSGGKPIFKWPNNYSWTFNGNLAGKSQIRDAVAFRGGKIDGALRFSIMWAEGDASDNSDLDAHAQEPGGEHIFYSTLFRKDRGGQRTRMTGQLDVDVTLPNALGNKNIAENIVWAEKPKMHDGTYKLWVNQFANRGSKGFRAEIEFEGETYEYEYDRPVAGNVMVAEVTLKDGQFCIKHLLPESRSNRELWGLETNEFHRVNLVCLSPNHWGGNAVGNKHYFFMLDGCRVDADVRGFHNENLLPDLLKHRKVMEVLGATCAIKVNSTDKQLSGLGFNSTVRDEVVLRLGGSFKRVIRVKF
jgi:hypothetical protein